MMMDKLINQQDFVDILIQIKQAKQKAYAQINTTLIELYWNVGQMISQKVSSATWGKGVVTELARFITLNDPTIKGFSDKNLWRMKQFYETYKDDQKLSALLRELHPSIENTFKDNVYFDVTR
jgi:hypothetical protein